MDLLDDALETSRKLRDAMAQELERARGERQLLRALDANGLLARAAQRNAFLAEAARLERELATSIGRAVGIVGPAEGTVEALRQLAPVSGEELARNVSDIRSLAGALREIDGLNLELARRAVACVNGYLEAMDPAPRAYDRRGARAGTRPVSLVSSKG